MRVGWNYTRAVNLARWGYAASYLQEQQAWEIIMPAAARLQHTFSSWQELGQTYLAARTKWFASDVYSRRQAEWAYRELFGDINSPWRKYPWNLNLGNGQVVPPSVEKTGWPFLAAHPEGLMCARIIVPNHDDQRSYLTALENTVGC